MVHEEYYEISLGLLADIVNIAESIRSNISMDSAIDYDVPIGTPTKSQIASEVTSDPSKNVTSIADFASIAESIKNINTKQSKAFGDMISHVLDEFSEVDPDTADNLSAISESVKKLSVSIATAAPLLLAGAIPISRMAGAIKMLGMSLIMFAPMALIATPIMLATLPILMYFVLPLTKVMKTTITDIANFNFLKVRLGSMALRHVGMSIAVFSGMLLVASNFLAKVDYSAVWDSLSTIGILALTYVTIGMVAKTINKGSIAVAGMALSLLMFAPTYMLASAVIASNTAALYQVPLMIGGLALAYGLAGQFAPYILMGSLAVAAIGASLWIVGAAVHKFASMPKHDDPSYIGETIESVIGGMVRGVRGITIKDAITIPLKAPALLLMSAALVGIADGVSKYKKDMPVWTYEDSYALEHSVISMSKSFAIAGSPIGMSTLFGFYVGKTDIERGIDSTYKMGSALTSISDGILTWDKMDLSYDQTREISNKIMRVLNVIPANFAVIGARERGSRDDTFSLLGIDIPNPFARGDVELGISSVKNMGSILTSLSNGVSKWKTMDISHDDVTRIGTNISKVLNVIPFVFSTIGQVERGSMEDFSFLGINIPNPFARGDVELGISSVKNLGSVLSELYEGIKVWGTGEKITPEMIRHISNNMSHFLLSIPHSFAKVGKMESDTEGFLWGKGDVNKGISSVTNLLPLLTQITDTVKKLHDNPIDSSSLPILAGDIVSMVAKFSDQEHGILDKIIDPFTKFVKEFGKFTGHHKKYMSSINSTDEDKIEKNISWLGALKSLGEINPSVLSANLRGYNEAHSSGYIVPNGGYNSRMANLGNRSPFPNDMFNINIPDSSGINHPKIVNNTIVSENSNAPEIQNRSEHDKQQMEMMMQLFQMMDMRLSELSSKMVELTTHMKNGVIKINDVDPSNTFD